MARRTAAALLVLVAAVLLTLGLPLRQLHGSTQPDAFADHAAELLDDPAVRSLLVDSSTGAVVDAVEDVQAGAGPLARRIVAPRAARVVASPEFARAWRATARRGLRRTLDEDRREVAFTVADVAGVTTAATGPLPAALDAPLRRAGSVPVLTFERSRTAAARTARVARMSGLGLPFLLAAAVLLLAAPAVSPARRRSALHCGLAALGAGAVVAVATLVARATVIGGAAAGRDRDVAAAVWDALAGGLRTEALLLAAAGLVVVVVVALVGARRPPGRPAYPLG